MSGWHQHPQCSCALQPTWSPTTWWPYFFCNFYFEDCQAFVRSTLSKSTNCQGGKIYIFLFQLKSPEITILLSRREHLPSSYQIEWAKLTVWNKIPIQELISTFSVFKTAQRSLFKVCSTTGTKPKVESVPSVLLVCWPGAPYITTNRNLQSFLRGMSKYYLIKRCLWWKT